VETLLLRELGFRLSRLEAERARIDREIGVLRRQLRRVATDRTRRLLSKCPTRSTTLRKRSKER
jgi:hypothetical protein